MFLTGSRTSPAPPPIAPKAWIAVSIRRADTAPGRLFFAGFLAPGSEAGRGLVAVLVPVALPALFLALAGMAVSDHRARPGC